MTTLLILLSLCTLICSDSALSHFQNVVNDNTVNVALCTGGTSRTKLVHSINEVDNKKTPDDSLFNGSIESCAEQCLLAKFFCSSFVVVDLEGEMQCIMSHDDDLLTDNYFLPIDGEDDEEDDEDYLRARIVGAFKCVSHFVTRGLCYSIKEKIDNVKTISKAPTLLSEDRFDELLEGYGISESLNKDMWADMRTLLTKCLTALIVPKSTPTNFRDWVDVVELSGSTSKYTDNGEPSLKRTRPNNTPKSKILAELDLFIRVVNRNANTIYDDRKGILYIDSPDMQLLIIAYNDNDYVMAESRSSAPENPCFISIAGQLEYENIPWKTVMHNFMKATAHFGRVVNKSSMALYGDRNRALWLHIGELAGARKNRYDMELLLLQDLSKVVSILHKPKMMYTKSLRNSFPFEHVDIITQD